MAREAMIALHEVLEYQLPIGIVAIRAALDHLSLGEAMMGQRWHQITYRSVQICRVTSQGAQNDAIDETKLDRMQRERRSIYCLRHRAGICERAVEFEYPCVIWAGQPFRPPIFRAEG